MVTIVDDSFELRYLISVLLEKSLGTPCLCIASFKEAISQSNKVLESAVVILDINLGPGQPDGVAVYEWLKGQGYRGKVFFLTGHAKGGQQVRQAAKTGVSILEKPMAPEELIQLLAQAVGKVPVPFS